MRADARHAGARSEASRAKADLIVVPLFETIEDLRSAEPIMRAFYDLPGVEALIRALRRRSRT